MSELSKLSPTALSAAMRGGTNSWGMYGGSRAHICYVEPQTAYKTPRHRPMCRCGCRKRITWRGMANGVCLFEGCEMSVRRWLRTTQKVTP